MGFGAGPALIVRDTDTLMELLPNEPANQLVTRTDMHAFGAELRGEIKADFADLRGHLERLVVGGMIANAIAVVTALLA